MFISIASLSKNLEGQGPFRSESPTQGSRDYAAEAFENQQTLDTISMVLKEDDLERINKEFEIPGDLVLEVRRISGKVTSAHRNRCAVVPHLFSS